MLLFGDMILIQSRRKAHYHFNNYIDFETETYISVFVDITFFHRSVSLYRVHKVLDLNYINVEEIILQNNNDQVLYNICFKLFVFHV